MADERTFPDITFIDTDAAALRDRMIANYETYAGKTLYPATPERLFILWIASILAQERALFNDKAKQNLPRFARDQMLDSLGELFKDVERISEKYAVVTERFHISAVQPSAQLVPKGTRFTTNSGDPVFATTADAYVSAGNTYVDVPSACLMAGEIGNGYTPGQLSVIVDPFPLFDHCENITESEGGAPLEDDESYYAHMRESEDTYTTAGSVGAYAYYARTVSSSIADVRPVQDQETITRTLTVTSGKAYKGGDQLLTDTLVVYPHGSTTPATKTTDYTFTYDDGLLVISMLAGGALASQTSIDISIAQKLAGVAKIYVLMNDGQLPGTEILSAVETALSASDVRPLTDHVVASAPTVKTYNIDFTYYIPTDSPISSSVIEESVITAVGEYKSWQSARMGRDINPSKLNALLMTTGIKRADIASPVFQAVGKTEVAVIGTEDITNGGYEDE